MAFLDSSSSVVDCILTRKGRELLAKNDGSFKIVKFSFGDDEINYQLYNLNTDDDADILNLPILEPSSNEETALRYRLITMGQGAVSVARLVLTPNLLVLSSRIDPNPGIPTSGAITVKTIGGTDNSYSLTTRDARIATASLSNVTLDNDEDGGSTAIIIITAGDVSGSTLIDIVGNDTGAISTIAVNVKSLGSSIDNVQQ